jgi:hypothetical protein
MRKTAIKVAKSKKEIKPVKQADYAYLFDLEKIDDLPEDRQVLLNGSSKRGSICKAILELFEYCSEISLEMAIVGLYRKNGLSPKKATIYNSMAYLIKQKKIERMGTHLYRVIR